MPFAGVRIEAVAAVAAAALFACGGSTAKQRAAKGPLDAKLNRVLALWVDATAARGPAILAETRKLLAHLGAESQRQHVRSIKEIHYSQGKRLTGGFGWDRAEVPRNLVLRLNKKQVPKVRAWVRQTAAEHGRYFEETSNKNEYATALTPTAIVQVFHGPEASALVIALRRYPGDDTARLTWQQRETVANRWHEPRATKAERKHILGRLVFATNHERKRLPTVDGGIHVNERGQPHEHAEIACRIIAGYPAFYGAQLATVCHQVSNAPPGVRDQVTSAMLAKSFAKLGCAKAVADGFQRPQAEQAANLARTCRPGGRELLSPRAVQGRELWQTLVALYAEHLARRRAVATTPLHRAFLLRLLRSIKRE